MSRLTKAIRKALGIKRRHHSASVQTAGRLPDFFICGAAHSATTSLWQYLRQHPEIYMPATVEQKEPAYFCDVYGYTEWHHYLYLFHDAGNRKRVGEASTAYLTWPASAAKIRATISEAKIIISLRNPVERAWSLYKWMRAHGYEKIPTFAKALEAEDKVRFGNEDFVKNNGEYYYNFLYFHSGLYHAQVKRFFDIFGRERVHVQIFEEFILRPLEHVQRIFSFLDVDASFQPRIERHNATEAIPIDGAIRERLALKYRDEIMRVEDLLGRNLTKLWI